MEEQKKNWIWLDWIVFGIRTVNSLLFVIYFYELQDQFNVAYFGLALWIIAAYAIPLIFWRPGTIHILLFVIAEIILSASLSIYIVHMTQEGGYFMVPCLTIGYLATRRMLWWTIPIGVIALPIFEKFLLNALLEFMNLVISYSIAFGLGICLQIIFSSYQKMKRLLSENKRKNIELLQYAKQVEQLTLLEERSRMSKELHDTVGHTFTSTIVGLDAGIILLDAQPEKAREKLVQLRDLMVRGLEEVRRNVHAMTEDEEVTSLSIQLERLIVDFSKHTSTSIDFEIQGKETVIPGFIKIVMIRCLQESLTNAKRHGQASHINVVILFLDRKLTLKITDNGLGSDGVNKGFGLRNMEERVNLMNGQLNVYSELGKGTSITCYIPLN